MPRLLVPALSALLVTLLCAGGIVAVASFPGANGIGAVALTAPAHIELVTRRCPHCGWIESKREVLPTAEPLAPKTYEYTIRMADGSSSVFLEALPTSWRLKERLIVIGGARPLD